MDRLLLTTHEAADQLGIGRTKLYEYLGTEELPAVKIGRSVRVHIDDVRAFAERQRQTAQRQRGD